MNLRIIVPAKLILLLPTPLPQGLTDIAISVLAADHEADLAGGVGGDGGIGVFDGWEDFFAVFLQLGDKGEVEPLVLGWDGLAWFVLDRETNCKRCRLKVRMFGEGGEGEEETEESRDRTSTRIHEIYANVGERTTLCGNHSALFESAKQQLEVRLLEQALGWSLWIRGISDDDIEFVLVVVQELEPVSDVDLDFGVLVADGHSREVFLGETNDGLFLSRASQCQVCVLPRQYRTEWPPQRNRA